MFPLKKWLWRPHRPITSPPRLSLPCGGRCCLVVLSRRPETPARLVYRAPAMATRPGSNEFSRGRRAHAAAAAAGCLPLEVGVEHLGLGLRASHVARLRQQVRVIGQQGVVGGGGRERGVGSDNTLAGALARCRARRNMPSGCSSAGQESRPCSAAAMQGRGRSGDAPEQQVKRQLARRAYLENFVP